jgi:uncharacterized protein HemX
MSALAIPTPTKAPRMTEPREKALSAGWMTLLWIIAAAVVSAAISGGYYWGRGTSTQDSAAARMDAIENHTVALSNADRVYFEHELGNLRETEARDVIALSGRIDKLDTLLTRIQESVNTTSVTLEGIKSDVKYLVGRKANP